MYVFMQSQHTQVLEYTCCTHTHRHIKKQKKDEQYLCVCVVKCCIAWCVLHSGFTSMVERTFVAQILPFSFQLGGLKVRVPTLIEGGCTFNFQMSQTFVLMKRPSVHLLGAQH